LIVSHLSDSNKSHSFSVVQKEKEKEVLYFHSKRGGVKTGGER